jgi:phage gpG-like protein
MSVTVSVTIEGDEELRRGFQQLGVQITDWRPLWADIAAVFYVGESARFDTEGFGTWPALSPGYAKWKAKNYPGKPILTRTGALRESLTSKSGAAAIYEPEPQQLTLGTRIKYAEFHQTGTSRMPARPPVGISDDDVRVMLDVAHESFRRYCDRLGFETTE